MAPASPSSSPPSHPPSSLSPPMASEPNTESAPANIPRARSVQFSNPTTPMSRSISPRGGSAQYNEYTESSADEITPIVGRERGLGKGKSYDATSVHDGEANISGQGSVSSARRRKSGPSSRNGSVAAGDEGKERRGWLSGLAEKYGSVELDNKGSTARDHLALERTFLAWLRTSLAFASIGIAITQLFRLNTTISEREGYTPTNPDNTYHLRQVGKPLGATFLGIAILVLLIGGRRYFESQYWIIRGKFPASRGSVFLITFVAMALIASSLVIVCVVDPSVFEKK